VFSNMRQHSIGTLFLFSPISELDIT
jgi:hypothetical protein